MPIDRCPDGCPSAAAWSPRGLSLHFRGRVGVDRVDTSATAAKGTIAHMAQAGEYSAVMISATPLMKRNDVALTPGEIIMIDERAPAPSWLPLPDSMSMHPILHAVGADTAQEVS